MAYPWLSKKRLSTEEVSEAETRGLRTSEQQLIGNVSDDNISFPTFVNEELVTDNNCNKDIDTDFQASINDIKHADSSTGNIFTIDHSIRGTAKCKICKKHIAKEELRI